ncbi:MAG: hypothetical protein HY271_00505 [Deltaproteobacteria bacterium]|nr:hypothetical protein [Deltaproteobacteria bacterium]
MRELRPRMTAAEGMTITRRLRLLRRRAARWFQPPVRPGTSLEGVTREPPSPVVARGLKPPGPLH